MAEPAASLPAGGGADQAETGKSALDKARLNFPTLCAQFEPELKGWRCAHCKKSLSGSSTRARAHFDVSDNSVATCTRAPATIQDAVCAEYRDYQSKRSKKSHSSMSPVAANRQAGFLQPSINSLMKPVPKTIVEAFENELALFFVTKNIPFSAIESDHLLRAVKLAQQVQAVKLPSRRTLAGPILERVGKESLAWIGEKMSRFASDYGLTVASDGWSTKNNVAFTNIMLVTNELDQFLDCVWDVPNHSAEDIASITATALVNGKVRKEDVFQFVMDGAARSSFKILQKTYPQCFYTWCAAHSLDLLIEDICDVQYIDNLIVRARQLISFIMRHQSIVVEFKTHNQGLILRRPAVTRFATHFLALQRLVQSEQAVLHLFSSQQFTDWLASRKEADRGDATALRDECAAVSWFVKVKQIINLLEPIVKLLRDVDGVAIGMAGKLYYNMFVIQEGLNSLDGAAPIQAFPADARAAIQAAFSARWSKMHAPIHSVGFILDPEFQNFARYGQFAQHNIEIRRDWQETVKLFWPQQAAVIATELAMYRDGKGSFESGLSVDMTDLRRNAREWWFTFGESAPNLQRFALRLFSQPISASACERNWSLFSWVLGQRRHKIHPEKLKGMVQIIVAQAQRARMRTADPFANLPWITDEIETFDDGEQSAEEEQAALFNVPEPREGRE